MRASTGAGKIGNCPIFFPVLIACNFGSLSNLPGQFRIGRFDGFNEEESISSLLPLLRLPYPVYTMKARKSKRELTKRELQVFRFITSGRTNLQIAEKLDLSVKTVEAHKHNILLKLGADSTEDLKRYKGKKL